MGKCAPVLFGYRHLTGLRALTLELHGEPVLQQRCPRTQRLSVRSDVLSKVAKRASGCA
jgi:hypothetical protein